MGYKSFSQQATDLRARAAVAKAARRARRLAASIKRANANWRRRNHQRLLNLERDTRAAAKLDPPNLCDRCGQPIGKRAKGEKNVCYRVACWR